MKKPLLSPARRRFVDRMIAALRQGGETRPIRYDGHENQLLIGQDRKPALRLFLDNAYQVYRDASPERREEVIRQYAGSALATQQGTALADRFDQALPHLLPRVNPRIHYALAATRGADERFWHRPLGEHLAVGLAYDLPCGIADVSERFLADWGVTGEEAFAAACDNLRRRSTHPFASPAPGVFVWPWDDNYGASRLALTELVRDLEVKGSYVALAPDRDTLIVTGSEDPAGLRVMLSLAEEAFRHPYRLSGVAIRFHDGQWQPFEPDACHPGLEGFRALRLQSLASAYQGQKKVLDASPEAKAEDLFVASSMLISRDRRMPLTSYAVWAEGVPTLLPRTEKVGFVKGNPGRGSQVAAFADWERVREVAGDLMRPLDMYPQRFRVDHFPTAQQLKALGFAPGFKCLAAGL